MKEFSYTITDPLGIHARPAGIFAKKMLEFSSKVSLIRGDDASDGKKLIALMKLRVKNGETVTVRAEGDDEEAAIEAAKSFLSGAL
jgi:phosphotransferase system HPr (HPr) family protein